MAKFVWESEEEWLDSPGEPLPRRVWPWKRIILWFALILVLGLGTAAVLYSRIKQAEAELTAEILSSRDLVRTALENQDRELFVSLLSGRSGEWVNTQIARYKLDEIDGFRPLGLQLVDGAGGESRYAASLEPDLLGAEVAALETYEDRFGRSFSLEKTEIYRQGRERWLLAPPESDFWGEWREYIEPGKWLDVRFPERDAAVIWPIRAYLEEKVNALCQLRTYHCRSDLKFDLIFHSDPYILVDWSDPTYRLTRGDNIVVPAPSLIGIPRDQVGQEALQRAYGALILPKIIVDLLDYDCCEGRTELIEALIDQQLVQFGLLPEPLTAQAFADFISPSNATFDQPLAVVEAEFWVSYLGRGSEEILNDLIADGEIAGGISLASLPVQREFLAFVLDHLPADQIETPLKPAEKVGLVCQAAGTGANHLVTYDPSGTGWDIGPVLRGESFYQVFSLGQGKIILVEDGTKVLYWEGGESKTLLDDPDGQTLFYTSQFLNAASQLTFVAVEKGSEDILFYSLDKSACGFDTCAIEVRRELEFWSLGGLYALVAEIFGEERIWLEDRAGRELRPLTNQMLDLSLTPGFFWWDDETFLTVSGDDNQGETTFWAESIDGSRELMFALSDLVIKSNGSVRPEESIRGVTAVPGRRDLALLTALTPSDEVFFLVYNWRSGQSYARVPFDSMELPPTWSPDRRWLLLTVDVLDSVSHTPKLIDMVTFEAADLIPTQFPGRNPLETVPSPGLAWSDDSRWLVQFNQGFLGLIAPNDNQRAIIPYPESLGFCWGGGWLGP